MNCHISHNPKRSHSNSGKDVCLEKPWKEIKDQNTIKAEKKEKFRKKNKEWFENKKEAELQNKRKTFTIIFFFFLFFLPSNFPFQCLARLVFVCQLSISNLFYVFFHSFLFLFSVSFSLFKFFGLTIFVHWNVSHTPHN